MATQQNQHLKMKMMADKNIFVEAIVAEMVMRLKDPHDVEILKQTRAKVENLFTEVACRATACAAMIYYADDPPYMYELLRPALTIRDGAPDPVYRRIAHAALFRRRVARPGVNRERGAA
jgi:hypothetical protein